MANGTVATVSVIVIVCNVSVMYIDEFPIYKVNEIYLDISEV